MLTRYGRREWLGGAILVFGLVLPACFIAWRGNPVSASLLAGFSVFCWVVLAAFFRDPRRTVPPDSSLMVSPADGVVRDIELIPASEETRCFKDKSTVRIGIFLSVLDVHLNRAPCDLEVKDKVLRHGVFHDARDERASEKNEAVTIICEGEASLGRFPLMVRQISGAIARRIVCPLESGSRLCRGERYGMIKFGSRTELYLPADGRFELLVKVGDRVYAGETPVVRMHSGEESPT